MVAEFRKLFFSFEELKSAIEIFHTNKSIPFPEGTIVGITLNEKPSVSAHVQVAHIDNDAPNIVELDTNMLAATLLYYCHEKHIPLPKAGGKEISKVKHGVALHITLPNPASR